MNSYELKQAARRERLEAAADQAQRQADSTLNGARSMASAIPFGQPILVGHYSEKRDRNYRARIDRRYERGFKLMDKASELSNRAASVGSGGISSDDPDAVVKLRAELAAAVARQARMKAVNAAARRYKKNPASLEKSGLDEADQEKVRNYVPAYSWEPCPFAPYQLQNLGANIRRIKQRIAQLEARAGDVTSERQVGDVRIVDNVEDNRLQLFFPGKPSDEVRSRLKRSGFRWSPMAGAWQRQRSTGATWAANEVVAFYQEAVT